MLEALSFEEANFSMNYQNSKIKITNLSSDLYNSSESAIGGFQFDLEGGATVTGGSGGAAADAGFVVQGAGTTVLGFSFTGSNIPAGCGTLTDVALVGEATGLTGIVISDELGVQVAFT